MTQAVIDELRREKVDRTGLDTEVAAAAKQVRMGATVGELSSQGKNGSRRRLADGPAH